MKCIFLKNTHKEANGLKNCKTINTALKAFANSLTRIVVTQISESTRFILSQSDFSVKVKDQNRRGRQMDKRTCIGKEIIGTQIGL